MPLSQDGILKLVKLHRRSSFFVEFKKLRGHFTGEMGKLKTDDEKDHFAKQFVESFLSQNKLNLQEFYELLSFCNKGRETIKDPSFLDSLIRNFFTDKSKDNELNADLVFATLEMLMCLLKDKDGEQKKHIYKNLITQFAFKKMPELTIEDLGFLLKLSLMHDRTFTDQRKIIIDAWLRSNPHMSISPLLMVSQIYIAHDRNIEAFGLIASHLTVPNIDSFLQKIFSVKPEIFDEKNLKNFCLVMLTIVSAVTKKPMSCEIAVKLCEIFCKDNPRLQAMLLQSMISNKVIQLKYQMGSIDETKSYILCLPDDDTRKIFAFTENILRALTSDRDRETFDLCRDIFHPEEVKEDSPNYHFDGPFKITPKSIPKELEVVSNFILPINLSEIFSRHRFVGDVSKIKFPHKPLPEPEYKEFLRDILAKACKSPSILPTLSESVEICKTLFGLDDSKHIANLKIGASFLQLLSSQPNEVICFLNSKLGIAALHEIYRADDNLSHSKNLADRVLESFDVMADKKNPILFELLKEKISLRLAMDRYPDSWKKAMPQQDGAASAAVQAPSQKSQDDADKKKLDKILQNLSKKDLAEFASYFILQEILQTSFYHDDNLRHFRSKCESHIAAIANQIAEDKVSSSVRSPTAFAAGIKDSGVNPHNQVGI